MYNNGRGYENPSFFCLVMKYKSENFTLFQGDSSEVLKTFDDECIDMVITSPPYDNLRNYNGFSLALSPTMGDFRLFCIYPQDGYRTKRDSNSYTLRIYLM